MLTALLLLLGADTIAAQAGLAASGQDRAYETTTLSTPHHEALADRTSMNSQPDETIDFIAAICYLLVTIGCFSLFFHIIGEDKNHHVTAS